MMPILAIPVTANTASNAVVKVTVPKLSTVITPNAFTIKVYLNGGYLSFRLLDQNSKAVVKKLVTVYLNGKTYNVYTNANGNGKAYVRITNAKTYTAT